MSNASTYECPNKIHLAGLENIHHILPHEVSVLLSKSLHSSKSNTTSMTYEEIEFFLVEYNIISIHPSSLFLSLPQLFIPWLSRWQGWHSEQQWKWVPSVWFEGTSSKCDSCSVSQISETVSSHPHQENWWMEANTLTSNWKCQFWSTTYSLWPYHYFCYVQIQKSRILQSFIHVHVQIQLCDSCIYVP